MTLLNYKVAIRILSQIVVKQKPLIVAIMILLIGNNIVSALLTIQI